VKSLKVMKKNEEEDLTTKNLILGRKEDNSEFILLKFICSIHEIKNNCYDSIEGCQQASTLLLFSLENQICLPFHLVE